MERFHCFDYNSSPILEGCFCFALHINGYTDSLLGAPTVILNKMTCGYISNEWATPFFSTQSCYWAAVHLVPVNCLLSILNNMKLAEYELKLILSLHMAPNTPSSLSTEISGSWKRLTCCIYGCYGNDDLRVEWDNKAVQVTKPHTNLFLPTANP